MFTQFYDKTISDSTKVNESTLALTMWYITTNMNYSFGTIAEGYIDKNELEDDAYYDKLKQTLQCFCLLISAHKDFHFMIEYTEDLLKAVNSTDANVLKESPSFMISLSKLNLMAGKVCINKTPLNTKDYALELQKFIFDLVGSLHNDCIDLNRLFKI